MYKSIIRHERLKIWRSHFYPEIFYNKIIERNLCIRGQKVLDLGTGTGVLPRNMYRFRAEWIGTDISENQILQAQILSDKSNVNYPLPLGDG